VAGVLARAGAALGDAVVEEHALRHAAENAVATPPAAPEVSADLPAAPAVRRPRRLDGVAARLRSGAATWVAEPQPAPVKGLLRAWAQGPQPAGGGDGRAKRAFPASRRHRREFRDSEDTILD
jgi:hypothetical protein